MSRASVQGSRHRVPRLLRRTELRRRPFGVHGQSVGADVGLRAAACGGPNDR